MLPVAQDPARSGGRVRGRRKLTHHQRKGTPHMTGTMRMLSPSKLVSIAKDGRSYASQGGGAVIDAHESDVHALETAGYTPLSMSDMTPARPPVRRHRPHHLPTPRGTR